jgi:hypothetical protein
MGESTAGKNQGQCFARRHMSPGDYAYYSYALAVSRGTGIFYSDDRRDAKEFGGGISPRTIFGSRGRLEERGWFVRIDKGPRQKRNPVTGHMLSLRYRVLTHEEWTALHPGHCYFTKPPAADSATGPDAQFATGEVSPAADPSVTGCSFGNDRLQFLHSPAADSAAKVCKESREGRAEEKREPLPATSDRITPRDMQTLFDVAFGNDWKKEQIYQVAYNRFHVQVRDLSVAQFQAMLELVRERPPAIPRRIFGPAGRTSEDHIERLRRNVKLAGLDWKEKPEE